MKRFWPYLRPHSRRFSWAIAAMVAVAAFNGGAVLLLKPIVDRIFIARDLRILWLAVLGLPLLVAGKTAVSYAQNYLMSWIGQNVTQKLREDIFRHLLDLPIDFYDNRHSSAILSRVTSDLTMVQSALVSVPLYLIRDSMTLAFLTGSLFYLDWRFALIALAGAPLTGAAFLILGRKQRLSSLQSQAMMERLTDRFEESLRGIFVIKAFNYEEGALEKFREENGLFFDLIMRYLRATALAAPLMELSASIAVAALVYFGGIAVIAGHLTPGAFFAFLGAFWAAYAPIKNLARTNSELQRALASGERLFEILDQRRDPGFRRGAPCPGIKAGLRLESVSFRYPGAGTDSLHDISFALERGGRLALVGPAGAGKTTLVRLLLLLHEPTAGRILFDQTDARTLDPRSVRGRVGLVTGTTMVFNDTLRGNVALGRPVTRDQLEAACAAAGLADWAGALPEGYETPLGVGGTPLPFGVLRRIALARVALQDPELLLLEEIPSDCDNPAGAAFLSALRPLLRGRTVLCVGNRLQASLRFPRILILDRGRLTDSGDPTSLLARNSLYQRLCQGAEETSPLETQ